MCGVVATGLSQHLFNVEEYLFPLVDYLFKSVDYLFRWVAKKLQLVLYQLVKYFSPEKRKASSHIPQRTPD